MRFTYTVLALLAAGGLCGEFANATPLSPSHTSVLPSASFVPQRDRDYTIQDSMIAMTDGVRLHTRIAIPADGGGPWPVLLYRTPYNAEYDNCDWIANAGYVAVSQDTRGRFASQGVDRMFRDDGYGPDNQDGLETSQWIVRQPWCNGRIAAFGASASGITGNLLAAALPDSVRCIIAYIAAADLYDDLIFPGGALRQIDIETWLQGQGSEHNIDSIYAHPNHDAWWEWLDTTRRHSQETIPMFQVGGWFDIFPDGPLRAFTGLQYGGGPGAAGNQKLIMGPWDHSVNPSHTGELVFPDAGSESAAALIGSWGDFLNYWVSEIPNGVMDLPSVAYYLMGDVDEPAAPGNEWRATSVWPPPAVPVSLYLSESGVLSLDHPLQSEASETYSYDPQNPVPTLGGGNLVIPAGPYDQRPVLDRPDVLVYQTQPLTKPWEVTGAISLELFISSDCLDTDFTAKVCDVYPDGRAMLIGDGILRARHRLRMDGEDFLTPGETVPVTITLPQTAIVFNRGHRILVAISSSNSPRFDTNPNTGEPFMQHTTTRIAHNTVYRDRTHTSRLVLPMSGDLPAETVEDASWSGNFRLALSAGPNPFTMRTWIGFVLERPQAVEMFVIDAQGRRVRTLAARECASGAHRLIWDGTDNQGHPVAAGLYRYLLRCGAEECSGAIVRLR